MKGKVLLATQQQQQQSQQVSKNQTKSVSMISKSSSSSVVTDHSMQSESSQQQQQQQHGVGLLSPIWEVPTTTTNPNNHINYHNNNNNNNNNNNDRNGDRPQQRAMWRRIFPSWKGPCQPNVMTGGAPVKTILHSPSSFVPSSSSSQQQPPPPPPHEQSTQGSHPVTISVGSGRASTSTSTSTNTRPGKVITVAPSLPLPPPPPQQQPSQLPSTVNLPPLPTTLLQPPPPPPTPQQSSLLLPPIHRTSTSSSGVTSTVVPVSTTTTTTTTTKLKPPQSPRIDRPPSKLPPPHQQQRSFTTTSSTALATSNIIGVPPPPPQQHQQQHRPNTLSNHNSQRNLSFSSTGSRHRRSSGDWHIINSLQQISVSNNDDDDEPFDNQSLATAEPRYTSATFSTTHNNYNNDASTLLPPPPPPFPPPFDTIDQPKMERRISVLSDFDDLDDDNNNNNNDDDHIFDLSSDEEDDEADADDDDVNHTAKSPTNLAYQQSYDSGTKSSSKDACSVSPTTVVLPPQVTLDTSAASTSTGTNTTTPDWMLAWAAAGSRTTPTKTPTTSKKMLEEDGHVDGNKILLQSPSPIITTTTQSGPEGNETASCSTSTLSCCNTDEVSSVSDSNETSLLQSNIVGVYLPIEPTVRPTTTNTVPKQRKVVFCAGWAMVLLWNDVHGSGSSSSDTIYTESNPLALPNSNNNHDDHNYDASIYYIELLQGGILRCTSAMRIVDGTNNVLEMTLNLDSSSSSPSWSVIPVTPTTAGSCVAIQYTSIQNVSFCSTGSVETEKRSCGGGHCCYILPVNITARTIERLHRKTIPTKNMKQTTKKINNKIQRQRHNYWLINESTIIDDATNIINNDNNESDAGTTTRRSNTAYAPQDQHDAVIFLRFALDAALRSSS